MPYLRRMQFELSLAGEDRASTRRMTTLHLMLAFVLCGLGAGCLVLYWFTAVSPKFSSAYSPFAVFGTGSMLAGALIAAVSIFYKNWLLKGKRSLLLRVFEVGIIGGGAILFYLADQRIPAGIFGIVAVMIALAVFWEARSPASQIVIIDETGVNMPKGAMSRLIRWSEVESVLLRHSILSIELTGNRLMQRSVTNTSIDSQALETYCTGMIRQYDKQRAANADW